MRTLMMSLTLAFFLFMPLVSYGTETLPSNNLSVRFYLERHTLTGLSKIIIPAGKAAAVDLSAIRVVSIKVNGTSLELGADAKAVNISPRESANTVEIEYEVSVTSQLRTDSQKNPGVVDGNIIDPSGIVLMGGWYPSVEGLSFFNLSAVLPVGFEGISEADEVLVKDITEGNKEHVFSFPHPVARITLVAGKYSVQRDFSGATEVVSYFLPEDAGLAKTYIEYTRKYIEMYEKLIGGYPFKRFAVVENIQPTGYSLPTYTLLGRDVVRLPFIVDTSLGHEILHQWFGNSVYVDNKGGNWSEGLTTYLADHRYEELKGRGRQYRKDIMISFQNYVTPENDMPLTSFTGRTDYASKAVGYGKAAMVFHMLRKMAGDDVFYRAINVFVEKNRFKAASWGDIKSTFETASGRDLSWFFTQWLEGKGASEVAVRGASVAYGGSKAVVSFEISQAGDDLRLPLLAKVKLREGETSELVELVKKTNALEIETEGQPVELVIDDNYDVFRHLTNEEFPPVVSRIFGGGSKIAVFPKGMEEEYAAVDAYLRGEGYSTKKEEIKYEDLKTSSVLIFGEENPLIDSLFGDLKKTDDDFSFVVRKNPYNTGEVIAIAGGSLSGGTEGYLRRVAHYGNYSRLSFRDGKNVLKATDETAAGIRVALAHDVVAVEMPRLHSIADIVEKARDKKIIYVGEVHDKFEHHRAQYEVLRELYRRNKNIVIGMEMFQKQFQKTLDDFISGEIDEREFLKKSQYFKRWGYDYSLYREILLFAREYKIPVAALNISNEIVSKVFKEGLLSLTAEEKNEIPPDMDISDAAYRARLKGLFEGHRNSESRNFDFFYEAQVLWDESMAHNLVAFMKEHAGHQAVVIAGMGHMAFGSGIPKRAYRLSGEDYLVILNDADVENGISDVMLFAQPISAPATPKLMVSLKEEDGKVKIQDFQPNSVSEKAGLKKDDIILTLDNTKVESIDDIKIFLLYKKKGETADVRVRRERFLLGPVEKTFKVTF